MKDYPRILNKIKTTPWLITDEGLDVVLSIVDKHINENINQDEINLRFGQSSESDGPSYKVQNGVGILPLTGPIFGKANLMTRYSGATSLEAFQSDLRAMINDSNVHSVLMQIDSPGGTADMVSEVGAEILKLRSEKPIYAVADTLAGSAAYWLMSQATKAYSTPSGSVGSIGVYTVHEDRSARDAAEGLKFTYTFAGPYKTEGNPHEPLSAEALKYRQEVVNEVYNEFVSAVAQGRNTTTEKVKEDFGGGRMLRPAKALDAGMIDGVMPYEQVVNSISNQPRKLSIAVGDKAFAEGTVVGNTVQISAFSPDLWGFGEKGPEISLEILNDSVIKLAQKGLEHSEPGTGSPPAPRTKEDGSDDKSIQGGWRRDPLPLPKDDPNAPKANSGGSIVNEDQLMQLMNILKIETTGDPAQDFERVSAVVTQMNSEVAPLRQAAAAANEELRFAAEYPKMYEQFKKEREENQAKRAESFANSVSGVKRAEGEKLVGTPFGLSALAVETIKEAHLKFAAGTVSVEDFENVVRTMTQGGILKYGETGSAQPAEEVELNGDTATGQLGIRQEFAKKIAEIQNQDKLDYGAAAELAAQRYPDLAAAYIKASPVATRPQ